MYTILIAEDDKTLRTNLMHFLRDEGYNVVLAENGAKAYSLAKDNLPDLIVSDIRMPLVNGLELITRLHNNPATSAIPVILITGEYDVLLEPRTDLGAEALIEKPFPLNELLDQIEKVCLRLIPLRLNSAGPDRKLK